MLKVSRVLSASLAGQYQDTANVLPAFQAILDASQALALRTHEAHWNVKGPFFGPLHGLFGDFYDFLEGFVDTVAERIVQLDGMARISHISLPPKDSQPATEWLSELTQSATSLATQVKDIRSQIQNDQVSQDILIEFGRELEKWLWKIESHLK